MNLEGGGCSEPRSRHYSPAWARVRLRLKGKKKKLLILNLLITTREKMAYNKFLWRKSDVTIFITRFYKSYVSYLFAEY